MRLLEKSNIYDIVRSHADMERSGGDLGRSVDPLELGLGAVLVGEAGVVGDGADAAAAQRLGDVVALGARQAVDDAALALELVGDELGQLADHARLGLLG